MTIAPLTHLQEATKITAEGLVDLFTITLEGPIYIRFTNGPEVTWQGNLYESLPCEISSTRRNAEEEKSRPTLKIMANPAGIWNSYIRQGLFDWANLERRTLLRSHLENNINLSDLELWYIRRPREVVSGQGVSFELARLSDGPMQVIPARAYIPGDGFPFVSLG